MLPDLRAFSHHEMTLTLHTFIDCISCLYWPSFRSQTAKVSKNALVSRFFMLKPIFKIDLAVK